MTNSNIIHIKTITEFHRLWGLPKPLHPLISVVDYASANLQSNNDSVTFECYSIAIKKGMNFDLKYGQQKYDFDEGVMLFTAPNQVIKMDNVQGENSSREGWTLFIHPDFLWNTSLAKSIKHYDFFQYFVSEALFLSEKEEALMTNIVQNIKQEYETNIDTFSQAIIISQIETLLNYADRFYQRQFITRKKANHQVLVQLEELLTDYFDSEKILDNGIPSVQFISEQLNLSPSYLSGLLKSLTGQSTQQLIQEKLIEKAKEKLSTTNLSISEIAYELGFEHPQSFSKIFKSKTQLTPLEFRRSLYQN